MPEQRNRDHGLSATELAQAGKFNDAIAATTAKAKLGGLWVERSERTSIKAPTQLSDEELMARIQADQDTAGQLQ